MEDQGSVKRLLQKYRRGQTSVEEENWLSSHFVNSATDDKDLAADAAEFIFYHRLKSASLSGDFITSRILPLTGARPQKSYAIVPYWSKIAATVALLLTGFGVGQFINTDKTTTRSLQADMKELKTEMSSLKKIAIVSLLQEESVHKKIKALFLAGQLDNIDADLVKMILKTAESSESINVRLTAVDVLAQRPSNDSIKFALIPLLLKQTESAVQMSILDVIRQLNDTQLLHQLRSIQDQSLLSPEAKQEIKSILTQSRNL